MADPTLEPLGEDALLLRWGDTIDAAINRRVVATAARLRADAPAWLRDVVPAYASLAVFVDPAQLPRDPRGATAGAHDPLAAVRAWLAARLDGATAGRDDDVGSVVEIPVCYGGEHGPDLDAVAASAGLSRDEVIARHTRPDYPVAMLGFSPGFPYLLGLDPVLATPRLATPRPRVPAGSVGIGGAQTGVYPDAGPGGWRLLGRTPRRLFDPHRPVPAALRPGDRVRFVAIDAAAFAAWRDDDEASCGSASRRDRESRDERHAATVDVVTPGLQTTVQDLGRHGFRHLGVGVAGALDDTSARIANRLVGNDEAAPLLEIALVGPRLHFHRAARIALTGAELGARVGGIAIPCGRPVSLPAGTTLDVGACRRGARAYLAFAGGVQVARVLGSAATDLRAGFGGVAGRALRAGDALVLDGVIRASGDHARGAGDADDVRPAHDGPEAACAVGVPSWPRWWVDPHPDLDLDDPRPLRVLAGRDATTPLEALCAQAWRVAAQSDRQGVRLQGAPLVAAHAGERVSEPVAPGTIQLPPDGQPIVLLGEAQTIGGYPRIGHVIAADLPRLAQRRPGDPVRFATIDAAAAHRLACERRARLARMALAIERATRA